MEKSLIKGRIRVLFMVPSLRRAGAETQVVNLANGLDAEDFDKHLLIFEKEADQMPRLDQSIRFHQARRTRRWFDFSLVAQVAKVIDSEGIDVVHCSLQFALLWGWLGSRTANRKPAVIASLHTTINQGIKSELQDQLLYQWILRACQGIVFVCERQQKYWERKYPFLVGRSEVVYNGVDTDRFDPSAFHSEGRAFRVAHALPDNAIVLANVARFAPEKGQHLLLKACAALDPNVYLVFAGSGPLQGEMQRLAQELGMTGRVRFAGDLSDVRPLLAAADLLVLPSTAVETFSMAMLEALSMATPVIGSNIGGMAEAVFDGETGALVQPGDVAGLTRTIEALVADRARLQDMGSNGRELVVKRFSETLMIQRTAEVIRRIAR